MKQRLSAALLVLLSAGALSAAAPAFAQATRAKVDLRCEAVGRGPTLECVTQIQGSDGKPLDGAQVQLGATMPSMAMAHHVKTVTAAPTGKAGEYRGTLVLEMSGVWAVQIDVAGPLRDRAVVRIQADECKATEKRCAVRAAIP